MEDKDDKDKYLSAYLSEKSIESNLALFISSREMEVLRCLIKGSSIKEIAEKLSISKLTVSMHVKNLIEKFKVKTKQELVSSAKQSFNSKI